MIESATGGDDGTEPVREDEAVSALDMARDVMPAEPETPAREQAPASTSAPDGSEPPKRRRGRPPGSKTGTRAPRDYKAERERAKRRGASEPAAAERPVAGVRAAKTKAALIDEIEERNEALNRLEAENAALRAQAATEVVGRMEHALAAFFRVGSKMLARRRGPHWALTEDETRELGAAWAVVAAPYSAEIGEHLPVIMAIGVTLDVALPRLERDAEYAESVAKQGGTIPGAHPAGAIPAGG